MEKLVEILKLVGSFLTPFDWRKLVSLIVVVLAIALALYLTSCHVVRQCDSFTTVKVDRIDTIRYQSRIHKDSRGFDHSLKFY